MTDFVDSNLIERKSKIVFHQKHNLKTGLERVSWKHFNFFPSGQQAIWETGKMKSGHPNSVLF